MILDRTSDGDVVILTWNDDENRFRGDSVDEWHATIDELEANGGPVALVVTGTGKFFSNGLDLDWLGANPTDGEQMLHGVHRLFGRMLTLNMYTVCALNGHAFAGGAMLSCAFDVRVMRADRGYWCLPEVDLGLPLTPAMYATVAAHLPQATLHDSIVTGRRYAAQDALAGGIVEHIAAEADVVTTAIELARPMASKNRSVIANHKRQMYGTAAALCGA